MSNVKRVYVEKKSGFDVQAKELKTEIRSYLGIKDVDSVRVLIRYDVENVSDETFEKACNGIFSEPPVDTLYKEEFPAEEGSRIFSVEFLPGQFDQRADSAVQCIQFIKEDEQPVIRTATTYVIHGGEGSLSDEEFEAIKEHCINPVDSREAQGEKPETLVTVFDEPADVKIFDGFKDMEENKLKELYDSLGLAMTFKDFQHIQNYFKSEEDRDPSMTEIRVLDTYWSDHCRHTTFSTELTDVSFGDGDYREPMEETYKQYIADHSEIFKGREDKFVCLMDLALMAMRKLKREGKLQDQEESDEINACSIVVPIEVDGVEEEWLVNFKNETHNHPTEIEPFGGAATCLGGAIRDPLSGRTYVYQAMRVTGAADPTVSVKDTLKGKLPQKKLVREAAHGYSSYGNQIGLATGAVKEIYHPNYVAKRMEIGAVLGAAPRRAVIRETSDPGDIIILLGGRTGRDGCGGATGSSKVHTEESIETCGAEVQKGNAPTERKIQRLFRREEVKDVREKWLGMLKDLNVCSQKGLVEMFDGSIGAASVFMPHGGKYQKTETQAMVAKLPVLTGDCDTVSMMSYGFDPYLSTWSPYHGAIYAVTESIAKIVAAGGDYSKIRFTFQEYFRRMTEDPHRWSQPFAALLGAYSAQLGYGLPSIGGKDSMSGTFEDIDVPPTLVSFAVDIAKEKDIITPELKKAGDKLVWLRIETDNYDIPVYEKVMDQYGKFTEDIHSGKIVAAYALDRHGIAAAVSKMAFGNGMGVKIEHDVDARDLFAPAFGDIIAEVPADKVSELGITYTVIGEVTDSAAIEYNDVKIALDEAVSAWEETLEKVFPTNSGAEGQDAKVETGLYDTSDIYICDHKIAQPTVFIPVMPGTNCEYDSAKAFERAGAKVITKVFRNMSASDIVDSVEVFEKAIEQSQIIMFPGGFSAGDEPDGSAKFFATAFKNAKMKEAVEKLLNERDGLALGICNGFQALIKLGLVPSGEITGQQPDSPTLTYNTIGRHISKMVYTKVVTNKSPWLAQAELGATYCSPASHGEGRFVASEEWIKKLYENGQIATRYVDADGNVQLNDEEWNVNGSYYAIEGITSPDGRVLGKMAHAERRGDSVAINIFGEQDMKIFESGVAYFK